MRTFVLTYFRTFEKTAWNSESTYARSLVRKYVSTVYGICFTFVHACAMPSISSQYCFMTSAASGIGSIP